MHIVDKDDKMSPSALIPFCDFGGDMSAMGIEIPLFAVPVCKSFQAKIFNDQLCYEVDLNRFANKTNVESNLKLGLSFIMDYNEDRQITFHDKISNRLEKGRSLGSSVVKTDEMKHAFIYLDTVGWYPTSNIHELMQVVVLV